MKHQDFTARKGKDYISTTTALEVLFNKKLQKARDFLGDEEMDRRMIKGGKRGDSLHDATIKIDTGNYIDLDFSLMDDVITANVEAFQRWNLSNVVKPILIEKKMFNDKYLYCGTPDRVYQLVNQNGYDLIDFKTGKVLDMKKCRYQLSGYKEVLKENGIDVVNRIILHFVDGQIKPIVLDPRDHDSDFMSFIYAKESYLRYYINK